jgi:hypothetical protein
MTAHVPEMVPEDLPSQKRPLPMLDDPRTPLEKLGNLDRYRKAAEVLMTADEHLMEALADMRRAVDALDGQDPLGMLKGRE